jgi:head-tail adaptor
MLTSQARFRVRYKGSISATHIIKINGQFWNIQNLAPLGRLNRDIVEIMAEQLDVSKVVIT